MAIHNIKMKKKNKTDWDILYPLTLASNVTASSGKTVQYELDTVFDKTATTTKNGAMSSADKSKLDGIEANANRYVHPNNTSTRHVTDAQISLWNDKYTKLEIDNKFNELNTGLDWKESVPTFNDIATTYPKPQDGWTVNTKDTDITYRYTGTAWIAISANAIPLASQSVDGKMSKTDKKNLDTLSIKVADLEEQIDSLNDGVTGDLTGLISRVGTAEKNITTITGQVSSLEKGKADINHNHDSVYSKSGHTHNYAGSSSAGGAANSAVKLATARTINGVTFDGTSNITTANWGTARTITIGNSGKSVNGSANVSWTLAEIGAAAASHGRHMPDTCNTVSDWNSATTTGWYMASGATNAPVAGQWFFGEVIAHNTNYVIQTVYQFTASTDAKAIPKYIRAKMNGTWGAWTNVTVSKEVPSSAKFTDTIYTHPTTSGNKHIPSGGSAGQILKWSADGTAAWSSDLSTHNHDDRYFRKVQDIGANVNLNTLTATGRYHQSTNENATIALNYPVAKAGLLKVYNDGYIYQEYHCFDNSAAYRRTKYGETWYGWTSLQGPKGNTGATGPQGEPGKNGQTGPQGTPGVTPTIKAGAVTTGEAGTNASVTATTSGTTTTFSFTIPRGATGQPGKNGMTGPQGAPGPNTISATTTTSGFTNAHFLFNNNGKVGAKAITAADVGALASGGTAANSSKLNNKAESAAATANTIVSRDSAGDVVARLLRTSYADQSNFSGAIAFRINNSTDNYTRYCNSPSAVRTWLGALALSGGTMTGALASSVTSATYLEANKGKAIINSTAAGTSYNMLAKMNSTNGVWTMGSYGTEFFLNYTSNSTISANTNAVTKKISLFNESGNTSFPGTVTAPTFSGALSGNARTATTLQTARTINGTSFNGSANIITANWGTARTITIGGTGKSVNGSANVTWSLAEIGALGKTEKAESAKTADAVAWANVTGKPSSFYTHPTTAGNKHIPTGGTSGQILKWSASGTAVWAAEKSYSVATQSANGLMSSADKKKLDGLSASSSSTVAVKYHIKPSVNGITLQLPSGYTVENCVIIAMYGYSSSLGSLMAPVYYPYTDFGLGPVAPSAPGRPSPNNQVWLRIDNVDIYEGDYLIIFQKITPVTSGVVVS